MNSKGYLLIEVLIVSVLLALAGTGLYTGLSQGIRAERMIRQADAAYDPLRSFWRRIEKDLRNSVILRGEKYTGKETDISFPVLVSEIRDVEKSFTLQRLHYFLKNGTLVRNEQKLSNKLLSEPTLERAVLKKIKSLKFKYAYLDEEERLRFESFWMEKPYFGIPKAVRIDVQLEQSPQVFSKLISIPQGKWGHIVPDSSHE